MLDPRLLRAFVTIVDAGSFTAAAGRLHMTQSTISQQLGRLEQAVGRTLIERAARPVRPTASGERLLGHARRILSLESEAMALLSESVGTSAIRIGLPDDIVTSRLSREFAAFSEQHREVRLDVTTGLSRDLSKRFRAGEFDVVVVKEPTASADHRATFPEAVGWFEAANTAGDWPDPIPLVAFPVGGLYREAMFERIERERRSWYVAFTGSSLNSVLVAVEAGLGLSLLPLGATAKYNVRLNESFGREPDMVVSIYSWEGAGHIGEVVEQITKVLADRFESQGCSRNSRG
ncbi:MULTISPECIES: LysR family transcriptional regulator [Microbulbifer]|uniref:LysR family transcriptional regulator n=1 Tax=Microbulbifer celer TaxID=435905 RepID=A0ABW3UBV5_9GAMM|nr:MULTISPECIES: LysR family transcriptional regulator [Microbulbifer]UFN59130.1 LysR family transcriptional regulator [Microbulbifer celer]